MKNFRADLTTDVTSRMLRIEFTLEEISEMHYERASPFPYESPEKNESGLSEKSTICSPRNLPAMPN